MTDQPRPLPPGGYPPATSWLTYPGNKETMIGIAHGPNQRRELLLAVSCDYDPEKNTSRVGFIVAGVV